MPRFIIHKHCRGDAGPVHWDLMLEVGSVLATWQVPNSPLDWDRTEILCRRLFDHRLVYLTYEGPIGNGRGEVALVEAGTYERMKEVEGIWTVVLSGRTMQGVLTLRQQEGAEWTLQFKGESM